MTAPDAADLILFAKLGRPPRPGELYRDVSCPQHRGIGYTSTGRVHEGCEAVAPIPAAEALERLLRWFRDDYNPYDADDVAKQELLAALLGPAPDEPPEWARQGARAWTEYEANSGPDDETVKQRRERMARHFARFARKEQG